MKIREKPRKPCECDGCKACCKCLPGMLVPGDWERIAAYVIGEQSSGLERVEFVKRNFVASDGALVMTADGNLQRIGTIVPRSRDDGSCVFFDRATELCRVHEVAPFGCAFLDVHMQRPEADPIVTEGLELIERDRLHMMEAAASVPTVDSSVEAWDDYTDSVWGFYALLRELLLEANLVATDVNVRRDRLQRELKKLGME